MRIGAILLAGVLAAACGSSSSEPPPARASGAAGGGGGAGGSANAAGAGEAGAPDVGDAGEPSAAGKTGSGVGGSHAAGRSGSGGSAPRAGKGGTGGAPTQMASEAGQVGESGAGGAPQAGASGEAGDLGVGSAGAGPDPCEGVMPWDPEASWTTYAENELRSFGGILWKCTQPGLCGTYPGSLGAPGWQHVEECVGGPTGEVAPCQCDAGQCCDGCYFKSFVTFLGENPYNSNCCSAFNSVDYAYQYCDGDSATVTRWSSITKTVGGCSPGGTCFSSGVPVTCPTSC